MPAPSTPAPRPMTDFADLNRNYFVTLPEPRVSMDEVRKAMEKAIAARGQLPKAVLHPEDARELRVMEMLRLGFDVIENEMVERGHVYVIQSSAVHLEGSALKLSTEGLGLITGIADT